MVIVDEYEKEKKIKIKKNVKSKVGIPPTMVLHFFCKVLKEKVFWEYRFEVCIFYERKLGFSKYNRFLIILPISLFGIFDGFYCII